MISRWCAWAFADVPRRTQVSSDTISSRTGVNARAQEITSATLALARQFGFRWLRTDVSWQLSEPSVGTYSFGELKRRFQLATASGFNILAILAYGHPEHTGMRAPRTAQERHAFAVFAGAAQSELGSLVSAWEIWNEPNVVPAWTPQPDVHAYVDLLNEVATGLWRQDPSAHLVSGGLSKVDLAYLQVLVPAVDLLKRQGSIALGLHPYRSSAPESLAEDLKRAALLDQKNRAVTPGGARVWSTEWGYARGFNPLGADRQADYAPRIPLVTAALDIPVSILFELRDGGPQGVFAYTYGMVSRIGAPYGMAHRFEALRDGMVDTAVQFRHVPAMPEDVWAVGSCESALVWPLSAGGDLGAVALGCADRLVISGSPSVCVFDIGRLKPAFPYWVRLGERC